MQKELFFTRLDTLSFITLTTEASINRSEHFHPFRMNRMGFELNLAEMQKCLQFLSFVHGFHLFPRIEINSIHTPRSSTTRRWWWRRREEKIKRVDLRAKFFMKLKWQRKRKDLYIYICTKCADTSSSKPCFILCELRIHLQSCNGIE